VDFVCSVVCSVQGGQSEVEMWSVLPGQHLLMTLLNVSKGTIERTVELPAPWISLNASRSEFNLRFCLKFKVQDLGSEAGSRVGNQGLSPKFKLGTQV